MSEGLENWQYLGCPGVCFILRGQLYDSEKQSFFRVQGCSSGPCDELVSFSLLTPAGEIGIQRELYTCLREVNTFSYYKD